MTRRTIIAAAAAAVLMTHGVGAQDIKIPVNISQLASKASSTVDVTLDGELLNLATQFMTKESKATDPDLVKMVPSSSRRCGSVPSARATRRKARTSTCSSNPRRAW